MADDSSVNINNFKNIGKLTLATKPGNGNDVSQKSNVSKSKKLDWSKVLKRHIFLKFMYFGWDYHGYATQPGTGLDTIEDNLFSALKTCCLIEDRNSSNYHRCGRTDAGVSAFSQVISIDVRSKLKEPSSQNVAEELPYCKMLNRLLPKNIRCYAWAYVKQDSSSRFDCTERSYNYFFPRGMLDVSAMKTAVKLLVGTHDFRNLCKMDVQNGVVKFQRTISFADIVPADEMESESGYQMMKLVIKSKGFLWHQIRCIMSVLLMVGEGNESPTVVSQLLDVESNPCKPQYLMANPLPLSLASADYETLDVGWNYEETEMEVLGGQLRNLWTEYATKAAMVKESMRILSEKSSKGMEWNRQTGLYCGKLPKDYTPLFSRPTCLSLDDRILSAERRRKKVENLESLETDAKKIKLEEYE